MEQVRKATKQELFQIIGFLDAKLPTTLTVHTQVLAQIWSMNPAYSVYFLLDSEDEYSAIMAASADVRQYENNKLQRFWLISAWSANEDALLKLYHSIDVFDWEKDEFLIYDSNFYDPYPVIGAFFGERKMKRIAMPIMRYIIDRQAALNLDIKLPDDIYIKSLEPCHAPTVYENWPHKYASSFERSLDNITYLPSAGVFLKDSDQLVSWAVSFPPIGISRFHTLEEFRRRGYGTYVLKYLSKRMAQAGYGPYGGIFSGNESSVRCFKSVGFELVSSAEPVNLVSDTV